MARDSPLQAAHESFSELARLAQQRDEDIDLGRAALVLARRRCPELPVETYLAKLDGIAARARERLGEDGDARRALAELNRQLFEIEGFRGDPRGDRDPRNSLLNEVLDRKVGNPVTLSVVYMEVARRLSLRVLGVGLPGHFLVRVQTEDGDLLVDPDRAGVQVTEEDCQRRLDGTYGGLVRLTPQMLLPVPKRRILLRILGNLKMLCLNAGDFDGALKVVEDILTLEPASVPDLRDRGLLHYRQNRFEEALRDLRKYLLLAHDADDRQQIRETVRAIETIQSVMR